MFHTEELSFHTICGFLIINIFSILIIIPNFRSLLFKDLKPIIMNIKKQLMTGFISFLVLLIASVVQAQQGTLSGGFDAKGSDGSVCYSIGQLVWDMYPGSNGSILQGMQQPYEISIVTSIDEIESISVNYMVFPNPTDGTVTIKVESLNDLKMRYQLIDIKGDCLLFGEIKSAETSVQMASLAPGVYLLGIFKNGIRIKIFKIIKNN